MSAGVDRRGELCYKLLKSGYEDDGAVVAKRIARNQL